MRRLAVAVIALLLSHHVQAQSDPEAKFRQAVIDEALIWITKVTDYKEIPALRFVIPLSPQQMRTWAIKLDGDPDRLTAFYRCLNEQGLYYPAGANWHDLGHQSIIVHELVHHAQCVNHRFTGAFCEREREAYSVQAQFIRMWKPLVADFEKDRLEAYAVEVETSADATCRALRNR